MRYASTSSAEAARGRLTAPRSPIVGGWLTLTTPSRGGRGNFYKPGKLAEPDLEQWTQAGEMLFAPGGVLDPYRTRPLFSGAGIGPIGCLVLAPVERCGPLTVPELVNLLRSYTEPQSARRRLRNLEGYELVRRYGDRYHTPPDLRQRVEALEADLGIAERFLQIDNARDRKWIAFQTQILGKPEINLVKATLRKLDCFYCGLPPPPTGGQVERFPPQKWGGSYDFSLLLPICKTCNTRHGNLLARSKGESAPNIAEPIRVVMEADPTDVVDHFAKLMTFDSIEYAIAMENGQIDDAKDAALRHFPIWAALKGLGAGAQIVNAGTGESHSGRSMGLAPTFLEFLEEFQGIPALLVPVRARSAQRKVNQRRKG